jgi:LuxR family maltose regulon positive regulatory protein
LPYRKGDRTAKTQLDCKPDPLYNLPMATPVLATKLYVPPLRPKVVPRPRLIERLNEGLKRTPGVTLISAPAGFGKTTLVSEWVAAGTRLEPKVRAAWLSLDEGDNDPIRFLAYLVAALQTIAANMGKGVLGVLQSPQPPPTEAILTTLLNEITALPDQFVLVLDDYHVIDAKPVDRALTFLLEHLPPQMHLVIATREDPQLPLARLRARGQLTELRAADLRFTPAEAAEFLNPVMGLQLSAADIAALEDRTEGWIAGLQLAALALRGPLSMQGQKDVNGFIQSFTGSHHFVLDYLVEEVLQQQPESVQTFLLRTSILDRLCGPLCDAVLLAPVGSGQATLEYIEHANLFVVPLDNERRWYRYHHLFADLLRQRLQQSMDASTEVGGRGVAELHVRASAWYESHGLELEAFQHAVSANDVERAERLMEGGGMPLQYRGAMAPVMHWLASLPAATLNARPSLWVTYASALNMAGQRFSSVEEKLHAAEAALALRGDEPDDKTRDLIGHIAAIRAMLAVPQNQVEAILVQSRRALEYLHPDNLPVRTTAAWTLGYAYQIQGKRAEASQAYAEAIAISQASGNIMVTIAAATCLGQVQETENKLHLAAESYERVLQLAGDPPLPAACEAFIGLARIWYEWNDLEAAGRHAQKSVRLAQQMETIDTPAACGVLLARLKLAQGDVPGAVAVLDEAEAFVRQRNFVHWLPAVAAAQVLTLLRQSHLAAAAQLAETHALTLSQARVHLAQGDPAAALAALEPMRQQAEAKNWADDRLKVLVLQAVALQAQGENEQAAQALRAALALAEPGGFVRTFVDEGPSMAALLREAAKHTTAPNYVRQLQAAFGKSEDPTPVTQPLVEPLSDRELEVLRLLRTDLNGPEMASQLSVSLSTLRTHTQNIFSKLGVNNRRAAVRRAEELGL